MTRLRIDKAISSQLFFFIEAEEKGRLCLVDRSPRLPTRNRRFFTACSNADCVGMNNQERTNKK